jgi:hypothetical protein
MKKNKYIKTFENFDEDLSTIDPINKNLNRSREEVIELIYNLSTFEKEELEKMSDEELLDLWYGLEMDEWSEELGNEDLLKQSDIIEKLGRSRKEVIELLYSSSDFEKEDLLIMTDDRLIELWNSLEMTDWSEELENED